jgi:hypothetical protein
MQGLHSAPPSINGYEPYGILAVCCHNLWPVLKMELGQEGWLKHPVAKVIKKTVSKEDLLWPVIRDHVSVFLCSKTSITGNPSSRSLGAPLGLERPPRREANEWTNETE